MPSSGPSVTSTGATLYLDLLKKCLTRFIFEDGYQPYPGPSRHLERVAYPLVRRFLASEGLQLVRPAPFEQEARAEGRDWPPTAETMIGLRRLDNLQQCITDVIARDIPGDLIETGVWRGGATIFMKAVLEAHAVRDRIVWVADSFQGLPRPDPQRYPADAGSDLWAAPLLSIPLEQVKANFVRYGLLDERVRFLPGWFRDTLPSAPIEQLAILRLDGDLYESTMDALSCLYPKLSVGGYVIVDDYGAIPACKLAVDDFRRDEGIGDVIEWIDWTGVFWQRTR